MSRFQNRLMWFISAPARKRFSAPGREQRFVWTHQQEIAGKRRHLPRKWIYDNGKRTAYAVNMHLLARRLALMTIARHRG